jgi:hypothetical protein
VTNPIVIASSRQAPMSRGGAGDGMSKNLHPAPTRSPRASPITVVSTAVAQNAAQLQPAKPAEDPQGSNSDEQDDAVTMRGDISAFFIRGAP